MKKVLALVLSLLFVLSAKANVVMSSNLVSTNDVLFSQGSSKSLIALQENSQMSKSIKELKHNLEQENQKTEAQPSKKENTIMEAESLTEVKKEKGEIDTYVVLHTEKGDIKIKLYLDKAPITAGNFLDLVKKKFYNGLNFHRLIHGFMIQGGCPIGNGTGNYIDPETKKPRYIKHESHPDLKHDKEGVVAMARTSDPDSASSQFFIDLGPQPFLNAGGADPYGYAVFGQVVEGMDVVHKIMNENVAPYPGSDGTSNPVKIKSAEVIE